METDLIRQEVKARKDLAAIARLREVPAFGGYFLRRVEEKIAARERRILDPATSSAETDIEKRIVRALREDVLRLLDSDEAACRNVIGDAEEPPPVG